MTTKQQLELHLNNCINFIENKGLKDELIEFFPKSDRDSILNFIETGRLEK